MSDEENNEQEQDDISDASNSGGTVLSPERIVASGIPIVNELSVYKTNLYLLVNDLDFTSMYPTIQVVCNIARETTKLIVRSIHKSEDLVRDLFAHLVNIKENSVYIGETFFNLPNYKEMEKLIDEKLKDNISTTNKLQ